MYCKYKLFLINLNKFTSLQTLCIKKTRSTNNSGISEKDMKTYEGYFFYFGNRINKHFTSS